jgi:hypothetical protein
MNGDEIVLELELMEKDGKEQGIRIFNEAWSRDTHGTLITKSVVFG